MNDAPQLIIQSIRNVAKVHIAAIIWFFVRLEMKRPSDMKHPPNKKIPKYVVRSGFHSGVPKAYNATIGIRVAASIAAYSPMAAINFPKIISTSVTGEVSNNSIVPDRFSSENVRIVTIGSTNKSVTAILPIDGPIKCWFTFMGGAPAPIDITERLCCRKKLRPGRKNNPKSVVNKPITTHPIGDPK
tara:strand:- start:1996 stop:2556 length:561 start_codon:yes stop_codon:yes gene_type:complete